MAWRDQWQEASFRGVKFRFRSAAGALGRRNVVHEYPGRDEAYVEDMGRKAREFTFEAFVIGADYMRWRDQLEEACEKEGSGELVHPTRGRMQVAVQDCRPTENIDAGGMASYALTFIQDGGNLNPSVRVDTSAAVDIAGDNATDAASKDFSKSFKVDGMPDFVNNDALATINDAMDGIRAAANGMMPDMSILPAFNAAAGGILGKLTALMRLPTDLASGIAGQIAGLRALGTSPLSAFNALATLFQFGKHAQTSGYVPAVPVTPARIQQASNRAAVQTLVRRIALIEAAKASSSVKYASREEAIALRDNLVAKLEAEAEDGAAPDPVYFALTDLRVAVVNDIQTRAADLESLMQYTPRATVPAIVLAYQIYEDPERDEDIVARNRVKHPGFVPGGRALELLTG
ncbi:tail protein [Sulfurimicrobium lacus]|uniref:Tail protein n=1 Tax=Sulfurimicrobium lacus TaxID=2715678 RepID=A0A6F8VAX3_9PROT|nr:DNA circularization N-terminal domain-containing protein [Sulfurimicrobium lacus]BCB26480.1 tail protein [Sulfurimicrobium lacus]